MPKVPVDRTDKKKGPAAVNEGAAASIRRPADRYVPGVRWSWFCGRVAGLESRKNIYIPSSNECQVGDILEQRHRGMMYFRIRSLCFLHNLTNCAN